jgi:hypothetical protein
MAVPPLIAKLRDLQSKAKAGTLGAHDRAQYERLRAELFRVATAAQAAQFPGDPVRKEMRAALTMKVEMTFPERGLEQATTVDVSAQGFAALLAFGPGLGVTAKFVMKVPGTSAVEGTCRVVSVTKQGALVRVSVAFVDIDTGARDRLEIAMLDHFLLRFPS